MGWTCLGIDIDPDVIEIASEVADLYRVTAEFRCQEATPEAVRALGHFQVALFLSSFQWVTQARGFDFARDVLRAAQEQSDVLFFETSMGTEGRAKMPMLPDSPAVERLLVQSGFHDEVRCLGDVPAPNVWLQKSRCVFRTRRTAP